MSEATRDIWKDAGWPPTQLEREVDLERWLLGVEGTQRGDGSQDPQTVALAVAAAVGLHDCQLCQHQFIHFGPPDRQFISHRLLCPDCMAGKRANVCAECGEAFLAKRNPQTRTGEGAQRVLCADCNALSTCETPEDRAAYVVNAWKVRLGCSGSTHYRLDPYDGYAGIAYRIWEDQTDHLGGAILHNP